VIGVLGGIAIIIGRFVNRNYPGERIGCSAGGLGFTILFYGIGWIPEGFIGLSK
jgi:hypothetical protein